jgi:hypothetical protein
MKLGTENKTKTAIAVGLLLVAGFAVYNWMSSGNDSAPAQPTTKSPTLSTAAAKTAGKPGTRKSAPVMLAQSLDPTLRTDLLKTSEDVTYKGAGRDIFQNQPEPPPVPKPIVDPMKDRTPPPPPPPPPIPLKFYGFSGNKSGPKEVFLSKGDDIFIAKEGQIVDRRYKILKIGPNSVEVEDVLNNNRQTLPLTAG